MVRHSLLLAQAVQQFREVQLSQGLGDKRLRGGGGGGGRREGGGKGGKKGGKGKKKGKEGKKGRKMDLFGHVGLFICHCCGVAIF